MTATTNHARTLHIGLAGLGNVGAGVYKNLDKNRDLLRGRTGADLVVKKIAVRDPSRPRDVDVPAEIVTTRLLDLVEDDGIDIIGMIVCPSDGDEHLCLRGNFAFFFGYADQQEGDGEHKNEAQKGIE